jgi:mono/diheme cytochrome c family protein
MGFPPRVSLPGLAGSLLFTALCTGPLAAQDAPAATYADVGPIFSQHCVLCHNGAGARKIDMQRLTVNAALAALARAKGAEFVTVFSHGSLEVEISA